LAQTPARSCQPCTACCDGWLQIHVSGLKVHPGKPCPHSTGKGCRIYADRPVDPCVNFICGWKMEGSALPDWMQPHNSKVIFLPNQTTWRNFPVDVAVPVGKRIPPRALNWLQQFAQTNNRMLLYSEQIAEKGTFTNRQRVAAYGPPDFQREMSERFADGNVNLGVIENSASTSIT
jgi:hypothetical protein